MPAVSTTLIIETMRDLASAATSLASWRTLALILALINLKNLPLAWHVSLQRVFFLFAPLDWSFSSSSFLFVGFNFGEHVLSFVNVV